MNAPVRTFEAKVPILGHPFYEVTNSGEIWRVGGLNPLKPVVAKRGGYLCVAIWEYGKGKTCPVHQLVALGFHGARPSPRHHAAHRDGDKLNNTPLNVQWITKEENEADKIAHGRTNRGERNGSAKVTDSQALEIRTRPLLRSSGGKRIRKGELQKLATEFGITCSAVWQIINGYRREAA